MDESRLGEVFLALLRRELRKLLGMDDVVQQLDRIEQRIETLNITPADVATLEGVRASLAGTDQVLDAIEPAEGDAPQ